MKPRLTVISLILVCLLLAACGGGHPARLGSGLPSIPVVSKASACPTNRAVMGCDTPRPLGLTYGVTPSSLSGPLFPDVSVWQGSVNWGAVAAWQRAHGWHPAAIFKLGEYTLDGQAARNAQQTAALRFWRAGYWFVRNTGCTHEAALIVWAAKRYGLRVIVLDAEVPEARGYSACLSPRLRAAGLIAIEYTSPGSNPDASNPGLDEWVASYGAAHVPCLFTCTVGASGRQSILAWQFTDGVYGPVVTIPGIGHDDVSIDFGVTRLGVQPKPKPARPLCIHRHESRAACAAAKARIARDWRAAASSQKALRRARQDVSGNHCVRPFRRAVCVHRGAAVSVFVRRVSYFTAQARALEAAS